MTETPHIRLELRSNPLYLSGARELVGAVARRLCFSDEACGQISLAVDEALCNIIRHGYERRADKPIWISITPIGGVEVPAVPGSEPAGKPESACACGGPTSAIRIVIEDEARQVDPEAIRSRDLDQVRPGGLGVHIIRSVMDEVTYERRTDAGGLGMRLTMVKRRTPDAGGLRGGTNQQALAAAGNGNAAAAGGCEGATDSGAAGLGGGGGPMGET